MNLSTEMLLVVAREFMRSMAQPVDRETAGRGLLSQEAVNAIWEQQKAQQQVHGVAGKQLEQLGGPVPMDVG